MSIKDGRMHGRTYGGTGRHTHRQIDEHHWYIRQSGQYKWNPAITWAWIWKSFQYTLTSVHIKTTSKLRDRWTSLIHKTIRSIQVKPCNNLSMNLKVVLIYPYQLAYQNHFKVTQYRTYARNLTTWEMNKTHVKNSGLHTLRYMSSLQVCNENDN